MPPKANGTYLTLLPAFLIAVLAAYAADYLLLNHDVAFFLNCADRMLHGGKLYKDIMDNNTPMIMFLSAIPVLVHMFTGLPLPEIFFLFAFALLWGGFWFGWTILCKHPAFTRPNVNCIGLALLSYMLFFLPDLTRDFGQREQLFCALILPYLAIMINKLSGVESSERTKIAASILAGIGICLKPHFLLIFAVTEIFYACYSRSLRFYSRAEPLIIGLIVAFYYLSMLFYAQDYFFEYAPHVLYTLHAYQGPFIAILFTGCVTTLIAFLFTIIPPRKSPYRKAMFFIFCLAAAAAIIFVVEKCNFAYHMLPEMFFIMLLLVFIASICARRIAVAVTFILAGGFIFLISGGLNVQSAVYEAVAPRTMILELADALKPYDSVIVFGGSVSPGFPAVIYAGTHWELHNACVCYVASDYEDQRQSVAITYHSPSEMIPGLRYFQDLAIGDIQKLPAAIAVDESRIQQAMPPNFDIVEHFMKDPRFLPAWAHYQPVKTIVAGPQKFTVYERVD